MARSGSGAVAHRIVGLFDAGTAIGQGDGRLIERFLDSNDPDAFGAIVAEHGPMVWGVCRRSLRDPNDAEDAFQATFLIFARKAGSIGRPDRLGGWLHGVASKVAARARRDSARRPTADADGVAARDRADDLEGRERADLLHEEIGRLPARYRDPIVLCHLEGCTHDEAAARLGWPVGTVRGRLSRGRDRLRDRLSRRGVASALVSPTTGPVPVALAESTARAACALASGRDLACVASARGVALMEGMLNIMIALNVRSAPALALASGLILAAGAGALSQVHGGQGPGAGAGPKSAEVRQPYSDPKFGFTIDVPEPWADAPLNGYAVPGVVRAAWSGPASASIVAFVQEPGIAIGARVVLDSSVKVSRKAGHKVDIAEVRPVAGMPAMWMVESGPGNGGTLGAPGNVDTTAHWVAIPRQKDLVVILLTCPSADYATRLPSFKAAIASMKIEGKSAGETANPAVNATVPTVGELNLGFEQVDGDPPRAKSWAVSGDGFSASTEGYLVGPVEGEAKAGGRSLRMQSTGRGQFGNAYLTIPGGVGAGKKVKVSCWIKSKDVAATGYAGLWCRIDGPDGLLAHDNMIVRVDADGDVTPNDRGVRGTTDSKRYSVEHDVPATATAIVFGAILLGEGTAWWDDFAIEVDGKPYPRP